MTTPCEAPTTIRQMKAGWWAPVAFVGGSLTVGTGSSDTSSHSWRRRFTRYLHDRYERLWHCRIGEVMLGIGAMPSYGMSFLFGRYAVLDGEEVPGPYTNWVADFGNFLMLGHGMEQGEHLLELTVQPPLRGKNLDNPTAWLAYACVAGSG